MQVIETNLHILKYFMLSYSIINPVEEPLIKDWTVNFYLR